MGSRSIKKTHNQQLQDPQVASEYINHALASEDVAIIMMAIRNVAQAQQEGIAGVASRGALKRESAYKTLSAAGNPTLSTLTALLHGLGLKMVVYPQEQAAPVFKQPPKASDDVISR